MTNFFDLPPEIRNNVYSQAHQNTLVNLRGTNRQLRDETYNLAPPVKLVGYTRSQYSSDSICRKMIGKTFPSEYHLAKFINKHRPIEDMHDSLYQGLDSSALESGRDPKQILKEHPVKYKPVPMTIPLLLRMKRFFALLF